MRALTADAGKETGTGAGVNTGTGTGAGTGVGAGAGVGAPDGGVITTGGTAHQAAGASLLAAAADADRATGKGEQALLPGGAPAEGDKSGPGATPNQVAHARRRTLTLTLTLTLSLTLTLTLTLTPNQVAEARRRSANEAAGVFPG